MTSNFPGGFAQGINVRGMPLLSSYAGKVFWVGTGGGRGSKGTFDRSYGTIAAALGACVADRGDIIMVKPGHAETISTAGGLTISKAGVSIIGMGTGAKRPTITFNGVVGADMNIDAANVTIANFLFLGGLDALTGPIDINADDCTLINIETRDVTGQATDFIVAVDVDRLTIDGWTHRGAAAAGADTAITIDGGDGLVIKNFWIDGNFAVAAIENVTTAMTNAWIYGDRPCYARTRNAADKIFTAVATSTGAFGPNVYMRVADDAANITEAIVGDDMNFFAPLLIANADNEQGFAWNGATSADS